MPDTIQREVDLQVPSDLRSIYIHRLRRWLEAQFASGNSILFLEGPGPAGFAGALQAALEGPGHAAVPMVVASCRADS